MARFKISFYKSYLQIVMVVALLLWAAINPAFALEPFYPNVPWGAAPAELKAYYGDAEFKAGTTETGQTLLYASRDKAEKPDSLFYFAKTANGFELNKVFCNMAMSGPTIREHERNEAYFLTQLVLVSEIEGARYYTEENFDVAANRKTSRHLLWANATVIDFTFTWQGATDKDAAVSTFDFNFYHIDHAEFAEMRAHLATLPWENLQ